MKRNGNEEQFVEQIEHVVTACNMNELMPDCRSQQFDIAFAQQRVGKNNDRMRQSGCDWNRQCFRAEHFDYSRARAKFNFTTIDDCCDSIVRLEFDSLTPNTSCSCPRLDEFENAKQKKSKIDCEQRESKCLIQ